MTLLDALARRPLIADGAMGTQLMTHGLIAGACCELWNATNPAVVRGIHAAYVAAGCDLLTTNSFGGARLALERHGLGDRVAELNSAAARLACAARDNAGLGAERWVLGNIGPLGAFLEPVGEVTTDQATAAFEEQIAALRAGGAQGVIIETMVDAAEMALAIRAARQLKAGPIIATFTFNRVSDTGGFATMMGTGPAAAVAAAREAGADVVGANCGTGLSFGDYVRLAMELVAAAGDAAVIVQPNAGQPEMKDGKLVHPATPAELAALVPRLMEVGVHIVGGCCGTTPDHMCEVVTASRGAGPRC